MKTKKISIWWALALVLLTAVVTFQSTVVFGDRFVRVSAAEADAEGELPLADQIINAVERKIIPLAQMYANLYVGDTLDPKKIAEGAAIGFVAYTGDKYGAYHPAEAYAELMQGYSGEFAGIGVSAVYNTEYGAIEILSVMRGSPALEAGLLAGDLIVGVDGKDVADIGYNEAINSIRGEIGTTVTLTVLRGAEKKEAFVVKAERRRVEEESVTFEPIYVDSHVFPIAYITITDFNDKSASQFLTALQEAKDAHVHGYIFDLRDNGGGELTAVLEMLDLLLPEGPIVRMQYKDGRERVYRSYEGELSEMCTVIVNGRTASASELFVSALRDYNKAFVIGTNTYGKGTVQTIYPFADGSALRISVALYAPPFSDNFEGVGIAPDIEVTLPDQYKNVNLLRIPHEEDTQLQAALDLYR